MAQPPDQLFSKKKVFRKPYLFHVKKKSIHNNLHLNRDDAKNGGVLQLLPVLLRPLAVVAVSSSRQVLPDPA